MSRRRREESLFRASYYDQLPVSQAPPLRAVTYPSEAHAQKLRQYREQWIEEFKGLQVAWNGRDRRAVAAIVGPDVLKEFEAGARAASEGVRSRASQFKINVADPADFWQEEGKEFVTRFIWRRDADCQTGQTSEFDEYWTYSRTLNESGSEAETGTPWVVAAIRRGNRERSLPRLASQGGG